MSGVYIKQHAVLFALFIASGSVYWNRTHQLLELCLPVHVWLRITLCTHKPILLPVLTEVLWEPALHDENTCSFLPAVSQTDYSLSVTQMRPTHAGVLMSDYSLPVTQAVHS